MLMTLFWELTLSGTLNIKRLENQMIYNYIGTGKFKVVNSMIMISNVEYYFSIVSVVMKGYL